MDRTNRVPTDEAARYLGMARSTLEKWRVYGNGPPFMKIGNRITYQIRDLESWLEAHRYTSTKQYPMDPP